MQAFQEGRRLRRRVMVQVLCLLAVLLPGIASSADSAGESGLAVAAVPSMKPVAVALNAAFERLHPGLTTSLASGTSAALGMQIGQGAVIDVLLSDDLALPQKLAAAGQADANSLRCIGVGRMALWTNTPGINPGRGRSVFAADYVQRIAIADPATSPYGQTALTALERLGVLDGAKPKLATFADDDQAAQRVLNKEADIGLIAFPLMKAPGYDGVGIYIVLPAGTYDANQHGAIVTKSGSANPMAQQYVDFLVSEAGQALMAEAGFDAPDSTSVTPKP